jgi:iron-sulfur cluster assembly accessory protein
MRINTTMNDILETVETAIPVQFTASAITELQRLMNTPDYKEGSALRVGVKGGGCAGMTYVLAFDQPGEKDQHYEVEGIPMIMNKAHGMYLLGMQVDFEHGLNSRGFVFTNPNAKNTCGCGTSFSV